LKSGGIFCHHIAYETKFEKSKKKLKNQVRDAILILIRNCVFDLMLNLIWIWRNIMVKERERAKVNYKPLWKMMIDKDISKAELREKTQIAPSTFTKMTNNEYVALDVLVRICEAMDCGLDDIVEIEKT
jgi:DNA-binding Xre family transcriptional regulator